MTPCHHCGIKTYQHQEPLQPHSPPSHFTPTKLSELSTYEFKSQHIGCSATEVYNSATLVERLIRARDVIYSQGSCRATLYGSAQLQVRT